MAKAMYVKAVDNSWYKVHQFVGMPTQVEPFDRMRTKFPSSNRTTKTLEYPLVSSGQFRSNQLKVSAMTANLYTDIVTEIPKLYDKYIIAVEFNVVDARNVVSTGFSLSAVDPVDTLMMLDIDTMNEYSCELVKRIKGKIEVGISPYVFNQISNTRSSMMSTVAEDYKVSITDVRIYQSKMEFDTFHNSVLNTMLTTLTPLDEYIKEYVPIYSTKEQKIELAPIFLDFVPTKIIFDVNLAIANVCTVYDEDKVTAILEDNKKKEEMGGETVPVEDNKPVGDGSNVADTDGYYTFYRRAEEYPVFQTYVVVANNFPDEDYDKDTMIRKYMVEQDITDIQLDEIVEFVEAFDQNYL